MHLISLMWLEYLSPSSTPGKFNLLLPGQINIRWEGTAAEQASICSLSYLSIRRRDNSAFEALPDLTGQIGEDESAMLAAGEWSLMANALLKIHFW